MSQGRLNGKIAIVTGSTKGIGEEIAYGFAREGAKVAVTGRDAKAGQRVVDKIVSEGGTARFVRLELNDEESVANCVKETVDHFGGLNVLVNNAAPTEFIVGLGEGDASVDELTLERWHKVTSVGLDGLFLTLRYAIQAMKKGSGGSIINISSNASLQGRGGHDAYTATKGAMNALTRSIAVNYAMDGIRCNCLVAGPFATETAKNALKDPKIMEAFLETTLTHSIAPPSAMAAPAVFFASDESYHITGQLLSVDGGITIMMPIPRVK